MRITAEKCRNFFYFAASVFLGGLAVYIFFKYLFRLFLPFVAAVLAAMVQRPAVNAVCRKTKLPKKIVGTALFLLLFSAAAALTVFLLGTLSREIKELAGYVGQNSDRILGELHGFFDRIGEKLPFLEKFSDKEAGDLLLSFALDSAAERLGSLAASIPDMLYSAAASLPDVLLFTVVLITSALYLCADYDKISERLGSVLPPPVLSFWRESKRRMKGTAFKYLRACALIILITFAELLCGFLLLGIDYAFLAAAFVALIDILPVLGVGTVLIPWALVLLLLGDYFKGAGLLIMYAVISLVRQLIEPHIVSRSVGLHPLTTLFSMYLGYELIGIPGIIIFPAAAATVYGALCERDALDRPAERAKK